MSDALTPEERAAIAAFPPDRIQRIEGPVARPAPYRWTGNPGSDFHLGKLVPTNPISNRDRLAAVKRQMWADKQSRARSIGSQRLTAVKRAVAESRRPRVADLRKAGMTLEDIAKTVGIAVSTVKEDLRAMGIKTERLSRLERAKRSNE